MRVGGVAALRNVCNAVRAARLVLQHTTHSLLAGDQAAEFAVEMGLARANLSTDASLAVHAAWHKKGCQPNFRVAVTPDPATACGPYAPVPRGSGRGGGGATAAPQWQQQQGWPSATAHDTIAMVAVSSGGSVAAGASSNGAIHKVPGRVGDAAVAGGGAYADSEVGGCGATGDRGCGLAAAARDGGSLQLHLCCRAANTPLLPNRPCDR